MPRSDKHWQQLYSIIPSLQTPQWAKVKQICSNTWVWKQEWHDSTLHLVKTAHGHIRQNWRHQKWGPLFLIQQALDDDGLKVYNSFRLSAEQEAKLRIYTANSRNDSASVSRTLEQPGLIITFYTRKRMKHLMIFTLDAMKRPLIVASVMTVRRNDLLNNCWPVRCWRTFISGC